jgi:hypothetical protein
MVVLSLKPAAKIGLVFDSAASERDRWSRATPSSGPAFGVKSRPLLTPSDKMLARLRGEISSAREIEL